MTKQRKAPAVISRKTYDAEILFYQLQANNLKDELSRANLIIEAQKEELGFKVNMMKELQEDNIQVTSSYANLKREHEMMKTQYQSHAMASELRTKEAIEDRNRAMAEATRYSEVVAVLSRKKWYHLLFNTK